MNRVRERWSRRELAAGAFLTVPSSRAAEAFGRVGYDLVLVEQQHGAISQEQLLQVIHALELADNTILVRIGENDMIGLARALDLGAHGIVVPMVSAAEQAQSIAAAAHYPPRGHRSLGGTRRYAGPAEANDDILCVAMIETPEAVADAAGIAAVDGIDALLLGPSDLALRLGLEPGAPATSRIVSEHFEAIVAACSGADCVPGYVAMNPAEAQTAALAGAGLLVYRSDLSLLGAAAKQDVAFLDALRRERHP